MSSANTFFFLLIGAPRSGKSTYSAKMIKGYPKNVIIVKHTSNVADTTHSFLAEKTTGNWRQGVPAGGYVKCKMAFADKKSYLPFLDWVKGNYRNGMLVVDDATIFEKNVLSEQMENIVAMRRHYGLDVVLIYHGFTKSPIGQYEFVNKLIIFNTTGNFTYKKDKIPEYDRVTEAVAKAKRTFQQGGYKPEMVDITSM